jgi:hypothetical protein
MRGLGNIVQKEGGIVSTPSNHSVDETVGKLKNVLQSKQITLSRATAYACLQTVRVDPARAKPAKLGANPAASIAS